MTRIALRSDVSSATVVWNLVDAQYVEVHPYPAPNVRTVSPTYVSATEHNTPNSSVLIVGVMGIPGNSKGWPLDPAHGEILVQYGASSPRPLDALPPEVLAVIRRRFPDHFGA